MFIIITAGIVIIIAVIIITIVIKCTCSNNRTPQESYPHFDANSIPPNYGYSSSNAHQSSSWACTFKGGQQMNTHIWETPLPEPQDGEYTLPASMKKQLGVGDQPTAMEQNHPTRESIRIGISPSQSHQAIPLSVNHTQSPVDSNTIQAQYTMPVKSMPNQHQADPALGTLESEYTMPVEMKQTTPCTATSDYTIPVLPQAVPDTPDSESEYTMPTGMNAREQKQNFRSGRSSLRKIL